MTHMVRDFVDIVDHSSLEAVINTLVALRDSLPDGADAELRVKGDEVFGRKLSVSFLRPHTPEEADCFARYQNLSTAPVVGLAA
ncbi:MAG: hypothetical protein KA533_02965 [Sphingobium sp.]|nr:hypothetical protein [Sphingobium sp.]MBP6111860.1 hypothetical protein [Sphingobium sp.]MBP8669802.1 hypothetical protein [Sphingobium sp.]MBP9156438.1 hypothetical protein [Sphingobium sp.]MCC6481770.1 hypothetical protein [Sphingomonadaceae bacterium]